MRSCTKHLMLLCRLGSLTNSAAEPMQKVHISFFCNHGMSTDEVLLQTMDDGLDLTRAVIYQDRKKDCLAYCQCCTGQKVMGAIKTTIVKTMLMLGKPYCLQGNICKLSETCLALQYLLEVTRQMLAQIENAQLPSAQQCCKLHLCGAGMY